MMLRQSGLILLMLGTAMSSAIVYQGSRQNSDAGSRGTTSSHVLFRSKRQSDGSILNDIFQIPIQTLSAVGQLFVSARRQRDKRRNEVNANSVNNYYNKGQEAYNVGQMSYNNGQTAYNNGYNAYNKPNNAYNNANNAYNNGVSVYNSRPLLMNGQTAYNRPTSNNIYNNGQSITNSRPLIHAYSGSSNNIGASAFSSAQSNNNNNSGYNRPFHYLSQLMSGYNRVSRTHGAKVSGLSEAADGSSFKI